MLQNTLSQDLENFEHKSEQYEFQAARDESGVWKIKAKDEASLFFAWGYLQTLDREFQLTLFWHIGLGRLSEIAGKSQLSRDKMMRLASHVAKWEYQNLPNNSLTKKAVNAFVEGRNLFLKKPPTAEPIEYTLMGLSRKTLEAWEPWHVLAIVRFHTYEFSYDLTQEQRWLSFESLFGQEFAKFLMPMEEKQSSSVYEQESIKDWAQKKLPSTKKITLPEVFIPETEKVSELKSTVPQSTFISRWFLKDTLHLGQAPWLPISSAAEKGASNAWLMASPAHKRLPTLCNDPHLAFSWPSALYPTRYEIQNIKIEGQGLMLPGVPAAVIASVSDLASQKSLAWGITMASFADSQDLIEVSEKTLKNARAIDERYKIKDPKTGEFSVEKFTHHFTPFGPKVDQSLNFAPATPTKALALDWIGYRKTFSLVEFFLKRNLFAQKDLFNDLSTEWIYPSVNFTWIERDQQDIHFGHAMTGFNFSRSSRFEHPFILSEEEALQRKTSTPNDRPFFYKKYDSTQETFLVSANHKIYPEKISRLIASDWLDSNRAQQILKHKEQNFRVPEWSQVDHTSLGLHKFLAAHIPLIRAEKICPTNATQQKNCSKHLEALARFNSDTLKNHWEPYLAFLWYSKVKENLWPNGLASKTSEHESLFSTWLRSGSSVRVLNQLSESPEKQKEWEALSHQNYQQMIENAYHQSYELLSQTYGSIENAKWSKGHPILWQHLFSLAPEPWRSILSDRILGREEVSGGLDSPARFDFHWKPSDPLNIPATNGQAARLCVEVSPNETQLNTRWSIPTGVSGNPFSKWSRIMPRKYFFQGKLFDPMRSNSQAQ